MAFWHSDIQLQLHRAMVAAEDLLWMAASWMWGARRSDTMK